MNFTIADDAVLSYASAFALELRFNQRKHVFSAVQNTCNRAQNIGQRYKAYVYYSSVKLFAENVAGKIPRVKIIDNYDIFVF